MVTHNKRYELLHLVIMVSVRSLKSQVVRKMLMVKANWLRSLNEAIVIQ